MLTGEPVWKAARDIKAGEQIDCWANGGGLTVTNVAITNDGAVIRLHFQGMTQWLEYWPWERIRMADKIIEGA